MYQTIYDVVEKRGRVKTGILLNGEDAGLKYLLEESSFFYPKRAERNKEAEEFLKASVEAAVETGVVKNGDRGDICGNLREESQADHTGWRPCFSSGSRDRQDAGLSCNSSWMTGRNL